MTSKWQTLTESKWATRLLMLNAVFSVFILVALAIFVDDVASALAVYFELGAAEKWQIISKFSTPILMTIVSLLLFNAVAVLISVYYSFRSYNYVDSLIKNINLALIGEQPIHPVKAFSAQTTALASKFTQLQNHQLAPARASVAPELPKSDVHDAS
ncbi:MAG: hypothetical protein OYH77_00455 [Pseudomonadota bacterium]|nr:hypothetical protein [Pseudomonadota bacterium]